MRTQTTRLTRPVTAIVAGTVALLVATCGFDKHKAAADRYLAQWSHPYTR